MDSFSSLQYPILCRSIWTPFSIVLECATAWVRQKEDCQRNYCSHVARFCEELDVRDERKDITDLVPRTRRP